MSIQGGLARNRALYRRLFGKEEDSSAPALPERDDAPFDDIPLTAEPPGEMVYRMVFAPDSPNLPSAAGEAIPPDAEAAAEALLRRIDAEARLYAQTLEED